MSKDVRPTSPAVETSKKVRSRRPSTKTGSTHSKSKQSSEKIRKPRKDQQRQQKDKEHEQQQHHKKKEVAKKDSKEVVPKKDDKERKEQDSQLPTEFEEVKAARRPAVAKSNRVRRKSFYPDETPSPTPNAASAGVSPSPAIAASTTPEPILVDAAGGPQNDSNDLASLDRDSASGRVPGAPKAPSEKATAAGEAHEKDAAINGKTPQKVSGEALGKAPHKKVSGEALGKAPHKKVSGEALGKDAAVNTPQKASGEIIGNGPAAKTSEKEHFNSTPAYPITPGGPRASKNLTKEKVKCDFFIHGMPKHKVNSSIVQNIAEGEHHHAKKEHK